MSPLLSNLKKCVRSHSHPPYICQFPYRRQFSKSMSLANHESHISITHRSERLFHQTTFRQQPIASPSVGSERTHSPTKSPDVTKTPPVDTDYSAAKAAHKKRASGSPDVLLSPKLLDIILDDDKWNENSNMPTKMIGAKPEEVVLTSPKQPVAEQRRTITGHTISVAAPADNIKKVGDMTKSAPLSPSAGILPKSFLSPGGQKGNGLKEVVELTPQKTAFQPAQRGNGILGTSMLNTAPVRLLGQDDGKYTINKACFVLDNSMVTKYLNGATLMTQ